MTYNLQSLYPTVSDLITNDKSLATIYGRRPSDGAIIPINIDNNGNLQLSGDITLNVSEITPVNCVQPNGSLLNTTTNLSLVGGQVLSLGQQLSSMSIPVVLASDQSPIPVAVTNNIVGVQTFVYNEQLTVASGATVTVVTYTVPVGKTFYFDSVQASGDTVGLYTIFNGATTIAKSRSTYGQYNATFNLNGLPFVAGQILSLVVTNDGTDVADFNGTIYGQLI